MKEPNLSVCSLLLRHLLLLLFFLLLGHLLHVLPLHPSGDEDEPDDDVGDGDDDNQMVKHLPAPGH